MRSFLLFICLCFLSIAVNAQATVLISAGGTVAVNDGDNFYDAGGVAGNDNNNNYTITLSPAVAGERVCLDFTMFKTYLGTFGGDVVDIFDGSNTAAPNIGSLMGDYTIKYNTGVSPYGVAVGPTGTRPAFLSASIFSSNNPAGTLTIRFTNSDASTNPGFAAKVVTYKKPGNPGCNILLTGSTNNVCTGGSLNLTATGTIVSAAVNSNFNSSSVDSGWSPSSSVTFTSNVCASPSLDGSIYLWMSNAGAPRRLTTVGMNVANGGILSFDYRQATNNGSASPCESPDINSAGGGTPEGVYVEYSTDGGTTWTTFKFIYPFDMASSSYNGCGNYVTSWRNMVIPIPAAAATANTMFRWNQEIVTGAAFDNWGLDNVVIASPKTTTITITNLTTGGTVVGSSTVSPYTVSVTPATTTTYRATISDGTVSCFSDFTVTVGNPSATISYPATPYANSIATPQPITFSGTTGGVYTASPAGLIINASTGAITPQGSTPNLYTVTYTIAAAGVCPLFTTTTTVTITGPQCGTCITPTCPIGTATNYANALSTHTAHCNALTITGPQVYVSYHTVTIGLSGILGLVASSNNGGPAGCAATRTFLLYPSGSCGVAGSAIAPGVLNANGSAYSNPEWTGLTPGATYILQITHTIAGGGCTILDHCQSYYSPNTAACTQCTTPTCTVTSITTTTAALGQTGITTALNAAGNQYNQTVTPGNSVTICVPVTVPAGSTVLGFKQLSQAAPGGCTDPSEEVVTYQLKPATNCAGAAILPNRPNASGVASGFNPEWDYVAPGNYVLCYTMSVTAFALCNTVDIFGLGYYNVIPPTVCQNYQIQMFSDVSTTIPITKTVFSCTDSRVFLGPATLPGTNDFNAGLPYNAVRISITVLTGNGNNLVIYRYNSANQLVETLPVTPGTAELNYFLRPTGQYYSLDKTNAQSGTYSYTITDVVSGITHATGIWTITAGAESAKSVLIIPSGSSVYSGAGVTNGLLPNLPTEDFTDDRGLGYFDPATAGAGPHVITYTWNNGLAAPNNCSLVRTMAVTVNPIAAPVASVTVQPTCTIPTGTIVITSPIGAAYEYSVDGTNYQAGTTFTGLAPATYFVTVKHLASGCVSVGAVTMLTVNAIPGAPAQPVISVTQPTCLVSTGTVTITAVGGITFSFDGGAYSATLIYGGLTAGSSHTVYAKNAAGCISVVTNAVIAAQPATPGAPAVTVTQPTCTVATGTITITGVAGETYSFDGGAYAATLVYGGLAAGSAHTILAKNAAGCISVVTNASINAQPATPGAPAVTVTQPTCTVATGTITITGVAGETYSFDGGAYAATLVYGGLAAGSAHTIFAKNAAGCISAVTNTSLNAQPATPGAPAVTVTQPTCTVATGTITITGVAGETYSFDGGAYAATLVYGGLAAGSAHTVLAKNAAGCISAVTNTSLNAQPATPGAPAVTVTQPTCTVATGTITITGVAGETYSFDGGAYAATLVYGGLAAGSAHTVLAKNAAGCISAVTNASVNAQPATPGAPAVTVTQPTCTVATGTITITGVAGETYSFDGGAYAATLIYGGLSAGSSHTIFAKNAAGCISAVTNITLNTISAAPAAPSVTLTQPTCTVSTGTITITGVAGETYSFDGGAYAATLVYGGLAAGSAHTVLAKNAAGCISAVTNASLNAQPATPGAPAVSVTQPTCTVATGTITITGVAGETYSVDGGAYAATLIYGGLAAGSAHTVLAKNAAGCISAVTNASLNAQPATPGAPAVSVTQPTCTVATGTITITGVAGETYSFDGGAYAATLVYGGLAAGSAHTVLAKNAAGCISAVTNASVNAQPATPGAPAVSVTQPTCTVATGTITITGVAGETYSFDGGAYAATLVYGGLAAGSAHTVLAKNAAGCISAVTNASLNAQPATPGAPAVTVTQPTCTVATGTITITGVAGETYSFDGGAYAATLVYGGLAAGSVHTVFAKNAAGCISAVTNASVNAQPATPGAPAVTVTQPTCTVATGTITITGVAGETYSFDGGAYAATLVYGGLAAGSAHTVLAKNAAGCISAVTNASLNAQPATPGAPAVTVAQPTCTVATGTITITGVAGETYSFDGGAYAATLVYGGLAAGSAHTVFAKNAAGCISAVTNASVNAQPATPGAPAVTVTQPTCTVATGTITITGVAGETYSFDGGAYAVTLVYGGLAAGSAHTILAKNSAGCISAVTNASVNAQPATPGAPAVTITQPTCTVATGTITITGVAGETYSFDGGAYAATLVYGGLAASSAHTVLAKNAAGCISAVTNASVNAQPATPGAPAVTVTQPTCTVSTGTITITGVAGETYSFDGGAYAATLVYGGLAAGSAHTVLAKNAAGCISAVTNASVNAQPATPGAPAVTVTQPTCTVATGTITITGVAGETYSVDGSAYAATLVYGGLAAGSAHTIFAKNAAGCISAVTNASINAQPATPGAPAVSVTQPTCTVATGTITITGVAGETYSFDGGAYAATLVYGGLAAGSAHTVLAKNAAGCISAVTNASINAQPATPGVPAVTVTQPTCTVATGTITITGVAGETYSFDGGAYAATLVYGGLAAGSAHTVLAKNAAGCISAVTNASINAQPATPGAPAVTVTQPTCTVATGTITITGVAGETYSVDGGTYAATLIYSGLAAGSAHTVLAKNAAGCISAVTNASVNAQPATPGAPAVSVTQTTCTVATGTITITGVAGETYSFDGGAYAATLVYGGLAAGSSHTIFAKNAAGCISAVTNASLNAQPATPGAPAVSVTQPTCTVATGTITITGVAGETYSFDGGAYAATLVYGGLAAGSAHTVLAKNAAGCISAVTNASINAQPATPGAPAVTVTQPTCTVSTGTITITGIAGETYSVDGGTYAATLIYSGLAAGSAHTILAKNAAGCISAVTNASVNAQPATPGAPAVTVTQPTCTVATGTITITGVAGETYSFDGGAYAATLIYGGLAAGSAHTVLAKNAAGCISAVTNASINAQPATPGAPAVTVTQPTCTVATGTITITGVAGETYSVDGGTYAATLIYSGLAAGSAHTILAKNAAGCISAVTNASVNAQPATPGAPAVTVTQPTCTVATGTITITGVAGETYSFDGGAYAATLTYSGLAAGSAHTILAKNTVGCISAVTNTTINAQPATPAAPAVTVTQPSCTVATGTITITGVAGETYSFDGGAYAATLVYSGLAAGSAHTVLAKNAAGCISAVTNASFNAQPATPGAPAVTVTQPTCTVATGTITITGVAGETYSVDGGTYSSTLIYNSLAAGTSHTVFSKNAAGCISAVTNASVNAQPATPGAPAVTVTQPTCTSATGTITITGVAGETYSFDGGAYAATLVYSGLAAGSAHAILAKNASGCISVSTSATINAAPPKPAVNFVLPTGLCLPNASAFFNNTTTISDGTIGLVTYVWNFGDGTGSITSPPNSPTHIYTAGGPFTVTLTATSNAGCVDSIKKTFSIISTPTAKDSVVNKNHLCSNQPVTLVNLSSVTGTGTVTKVEVYWDFPNMAIVTTDNAPAAGNSYTHAYPEFGAPDTVYKTVVVRAYNANGCFSDSVQVIKLLASPKIQLNALSSVCEDVPSLNLAGAFDIYGLGGNGVVLSGPGIAVSPVFSPALTGNGTFTIVYRDTAANGCLTSATQNIIVKPNPVLVYPSAFTTEPGYNVTLNPTAVSGVGLTYTWTELPNSNFPPANYLDNPIAPAPTVLNPTHDVKYMVKVTSNPDGCVDSALVIVNVLFDFVVPNTFTPNNDGVNDYWEIVNLAKYPVHRVQIFNRYGQLLFETNKYVHWDGTHKGKPLPFGTYYYIIELGGVQKAKTGYVTIIK